MEKTLERSGKKLFTREFCLLLFVNLFSGMAGQMTQPLIAKFAMHLGAGLEQASAITSLMSFAGLILCPFAGIVADRVNRKALYVVSNICYGLLLISHLLVKTPTGLTVIRFTTGIAFSFTNIVIYALSAVYIPKERYGEGMGYIALATILSQAAGPALGTALLDISDFVLTFVIAGLFAIMSAVVVLFMPYHEEPRERKAFSLRISDLIAPELLLFSFLAALFSTANGLISTFLVLIGDERKIEGIALFFTVYSVCMVALRPVAGKLLDKKGIYVILIPSIILAGLGLWLVGIGTTLAVMLIGGICKAFGQGSGNPSIQAHCIKSVDTKRAGVASSTCQIGQHIGNTIAPWLGGKAVAAMGYEKAFTWAAILLVILGAVALLVQRLWLDRKIKEDPVF